VGEVELSTAMERRGGTEEPSEAEKQAKMQEMDERISAFMEHYSWAFAEGEPVGKLTAYFEMQRRRTHGGTRP
jgi:thiamine-triphosphatase